ncbi:MAG TPA: FAD-binding oxidoreductase [Bryobacteraceae bacterium]|nr:FAD-binding oxidoreductase [Bryobacteraceae bacterium]
MATYHPRSSAEVASLLQDAAAQGQSVTVRGSGTKDRMAGPLTPAERIINMTGMDRVLQYEPRDLTISVEAGMRWSLLCSVLSRNGQMIPLDPPFAEHATVGGVVSANTAGPRRRLYGTARDVVIGMQFATLEGKLIQSGGMVVKNVAGLDMAKLMIGSFGTLAAIAVVNFKLMPSPVYSATFVRRFESLRDVMQFRDGLLTSTLQPASIDILNPAASERLGLSGWNTAIHVDGPNESVMQRYASELGGDVAPREFLFQLANFTPRFLIECPEGTITRVSTTLDGIVKAMENADGPAIARAGNGIVYRYAVAGNGGLLEGEKGAIEYAPDHLKTTLDLWPAPGSDFEIMKRIKGMFDPGNLLNRGRLYGRI